MGEAGTVSGRDGGRGMELSLEANIQELVTKAGNLYSTQHPLSRSYWPNTLPSCDSTRLQNYYNERLNLSNHPRNLRDVSVVLVV